MIVLVAVVVVVVGGGEGKGEGGRNHEQLINNRLNPLVPQSPEIKRGLQLRHMLFTEYVLERISLESDQIISTADHNLHNDQYSNNRKESEEISQYAHTNNLQCLNQA